MSRHLYGSIKRVIDVLVASLLLLILAPVILLGATAVLASTGRPVLFRQRRPGLDGEPFTLIKLRTMREGVGSDAGRLTATGRFLRSTSIDELPGLWNVVKGDMSLVGPRPLFVEYLPLYNEHQAKRHCVRPGITGLAQVSGRNLVDWDRRLDMDVEYVESYSLLLDLRILLKTVVEVARRSGISAKGEATMPHFTGSVQAGSGAVTGDSAAR